MFSPDIQELYLDDNINTKADNRFLDGYFKCSICNLAMKWRKEGTTTYSGWSCPRSSHGTVVVHDHSRYLELDKAILTLIYLKT